MTPNFNEQLWHCQETGFLFWKEHSPWRRSDLRACSSGGKYRYVWVNGKAYRAHRVAWWMAYGKWPTPTVDHRNRNGLDNRLINLREATRSQNQFNRGIPKNNISGVAGVNWHQTKGKWLVRHGGNYIGVFASFNAARAAKAAAEADKETEV